MARCSVIAAPARHDLIDVVACPVLIPSISNSLAKLKQALAPLLGGKREARGDRD